MKKIKKAIHRWILRRVAKRYGQEIVNAWVYFTFNYSFPGGNPIHWMNAVWGNAMGQHFYDKFDHLYKSYGCHAVMGMFWCELSDTFRKDLYHKLFNEYYANGQYW